MTFEQFRDKLAAECMLAINRDGKRIGSAIATGATCCPLGVLTGGWPDADTAAEEWDISRSEAVSFIRGFADCAGSRWKVRYFHLGAAYRRKFVEAQP